MQLLFKTYAISCLSQDINYFLSNYISFTLEFDSAAIVSCSTTVIESGNPPGTDAIPAEVYKARGLPMAEKLTELFHCI